VTSNEEETQITLHLQALQKEEEIVIT